MKLLCTHVNITISFIAHRQQLSLDEFDMDTIVLLLTVGEIIYLYINMQYLYKQELDQTISTLENISNIITLEHFFIQQYKRTSLQGLRMPPTSLYILRLRSCRINIFTSKIKKGATNKCDQRQVWKQSPAQQVWKQSPAQQYISEPAIPQDGSSVLEAGLSLFDYLHYILITEASLLTQNFCMISMFPLSYHYNIQMASLASIFEGMQLQRKHIGTYTSTCQIFTLFY